MHKSPYCSMIYSESIDTCLACAIDAATVTIGMAILASEIHNAMEKAPLL